MAKRKREIIIEEKCKWCGRDILRSPVTKEISHVWPPCSTFREKVMKGKAE